VNEKEKLRTDDARDELLEAIGRLAHAVGYAWPDADDSTASDVINDMIRHADAIAQAIAASRKEKDT
jgi:hypothetical protein